MWRVYHGQRTSNVNELSLSVTIVGFKHTILDFHKTRDLTSRLRLITFTYHFLVTCCFHYVCPFCWNDGWILKTSTGNIFCLHTMDFVHFLMEKSYTNYFMSCFTNLYHHNPYFATYSFGKEEKKVDIPVDDPFFSKQYCILPYRTLPDK